MTTAARGVALVTGAARGIGFACAEALAQAGYRLLLCDANATALDVAAAGLRGRGRAATALAGDLGSAATLDAIATAIAADGGLAACVHAAGLSGTMADAARVLDINLAATARLLDVLLPQVNAGAGIVCIASQSGHFIAPAASEEVKRVVDDPLGAGLSARLAAAMGVAELDSASAYALSKYGVLRLVVARAPAFGERGARLVSLSPGVIETPMGAQEMAAHTEAMRGIVAATPVQRRQGRPEEIASVAAFLCSPAAAFVCGSDVLVDGGSTRQILGGA